jgi:GTPase SAR1 family protein
MISIRIVYRLQSSTLLPGIFARAFGTGQFIDDLKWWFLPRQEDKMKLEMEVKKADAIVLTYSCDRAQTLDRLSTYWLPELRRLEIKVPVIVVGCKLDLRDDQQPSLEQVMAPLMHEFREIETCIECSALKQIQVFFSIQMCSITLSF